MILQERPRLSQETTAPTSASFLWCTPTVAKALFGHWAVDHHRGVGHCLSLPPRSHVLSNDLFGSWECLQSAWLTRCGTSVNLLPKTGLSWRDTRAFCNTHQNVGKIPPFPSIFDAEARLQQWIGESHLVIFRFAVNRDDAVGRFELPTSGRPPACWVRYRGPCYAPHCVCAPQSDSGPRVNHRGLRKNSAARHFFRHKERQLKHWCWWAWSAIILGNDGCMARELSNISRSTRLPIYPNMSTHEETLIV